MTILYLTFGEKTEFHVQAYLSMLSFRRQLTSDDRIVMVTTAPRLYHHMQDWAEVIPIDDQQIEAWQGDYHFFWRAKIKAIASTVRGKRRARTHSTTNTMGMLSSRSSNVVPAFVYLIDVM